MTTGRINQVTISKYKQKSKHSACARRRGLLHKKITTLTFLSVPLANQRQIEKSVVPDFPRTSPYNFHLDRSQESEAGLKTSHRPIKYRAAPPNDSGDLC